MSTTGARPSNSAQTRNVSRLNHTLDRNLAAYVAAAGAAGVSILALAPLAVGEIVSATTNISIGNKVALDFNSDGTTDLIFCWCGGASHSADLYVYGAGNAWFGATQAQPMFFGVPIGPGEHFVGGYDRMARIFGNTFSITGSSGAWANKTNRYLGVKFLISGVTHFGWVRLTVANYTATITGYAYETIPNRGLKAGHTSGLATKASIAPAEMLTPTKMPAMLGLLARGADTIAVWRREEEAL